MSTVERRGSQLQAALEACAQAAQAKRERMTAEHAAARAAADREAAQR